MTREEIIKSALKFLVLKQTEQGSWGYSDRNENEISWDKVLEWLEKQPCEDSISRQAVLESLKTDYSLIMFDSYGNLTFTGERNIEAIKRVPSVEPEKCGDCINREALLKKLQKVSTESWKMKLKCNAETVWNQCIDYVKDAPPVEPERKKGKWIKHYDDLFPEESTIECSECHNHQDITIDDNYCPNCGADMREVQDEHK